MAEKHSAIVAGHLCLDVIPHITGNSPEAFRAAFVPGHLIDVGPATLSTGGPVSNTGLALHKLGVPTQLMGKVGADLFGQAVSQRCRRSVPGWLTAWLSIRRPAPGTPSSSIHPASIVCSCTVPARTMVRLGDVRYDVLADVGLFDLAIRR